MPVTLSDTDPLLVMPARNLELALQARVFIVENVRTARRYLKRCARSLATDIDIDSLTFFTLDEHTSVADVDQMLEPLAGGEPTVLMSEAGCPAVADPGALAVAAAHRRGLQVVPLVGPSSILMALMASGFNGQRFAFEGYLPVERGKRSARLREMLTRITRERQTQIFIETPYRNNRLIEELCQTLPPQLRLCVASDLTGPAETIVTASLQQWRQRSYNYDKTPAIFLLYGQET